MKYFVCFSVNNILHDRIVEIPENVEAEALPDLLRKSVHPDRPGDRSDNLKGQSSRDCVIVNFIKLAN